MFAINTKDHVINALMQKQDAHFISTYKELKNQPSNDPVVFRSMAQRKTVSLCNKQGRDFFYVDTGYIGNTDTVTKKWFRVVKNNVQHTTVNYELPDTRFKTLCTTKSYLKFPGWKKDGGSILVVTPSEKPCKFYGVNKKQWLDNTLQLLDQFTDRKIIVREKEIKENRLKNNIYKQLDNDDVFAVVTYNSIAAIEAIGYGIPAFTTVPTAADDLCLKDLTKIESPLYADQQQVEKWQHWLAHCQYTLPEMKDGLVFKMIEEFDLQ